MTWAVRFEHVSKHYRRGGPRYASLRDDLTGLGRKVKSILMRQTAEEAGTLALDRLSFEVEEGEAFALVGPNGAGKTTALKLLARISYPTGGRIRLRGRVGALIEVGAGVHPELTGRENIWLYGRIMGMSRGEITRRFDEIVDFAELSDALDTPIKMYSSGMQLRLGFSIASHLDPDIFVVDEALAVGDAGFQARCVQRMVHLIAQGRALLFVSHNLYAVEAICSRGIYLNHGKLIVGAGIREVLTSYLNDIDHRRIASTAGVPDRFKGGPIVLSVRCMGPEGTPCIRTGETLKIVCDVHCAHPGIRAYFHFGVSDGRPGTLFLASQIMDGQPPVRLNRETRVVCVIPDPPLLPRVYEVWGEIRSDKGWGNFIDWQKLAEFRVVREPGDVTPSVSHSGVDAPMRTRFWFEQEKIGVHEAVSS